MLDLDHSAIHEGGQRHRGQKKPKLPLAMPRKTAWRRGLRQKGHLGYSWDSHSYCFSNHNESRLLTRDVSLPQVRFPSSSSWDFLPTWAWVVAGNCAFSRTKGVCSGLERCRACATDLLEKQPSKVLHLFRWCAARKIPQQVTIKAPQMGSWLWGCPFHSATSQLRQVTQLLESTSSSTKRDSCPSFQIFRGL